MPPTSPSRLSAENLALRKRVANLEAELRRAEELRAAAQSRLDGAHAFAAARRDSAPRPAVVGGLDQVLSSHERRFHTLAMHSPTGIFQADLRGRPLFVNQRYCTIAGVTTEVATADLFSTLHPEDRDRVLSGWQAALATRSEFVEEFRFLHPDGAVHAVTVDAVPLADASGQIDSYVGNILDVSLHRTAEESLRASESRYRLLSNCSPVGVFDADATGQVTYVNPRLLAIYCYEVRDMLGFGFLRAFPPDQRETVLSNWLRLANSSAPHNKEHRIITGDGRRRWVHIRSAPMIGPSGEILGRVGTVEDTTERRETEERYRLLADNSTDLISKHSASGIFLYASPACRVLMGYEPEELLGQNANDFLHPDDRAALTLSRAKVSNSFSGGTDSHRVRRKDGNYVWFETVSKSVVDPDSGKLEFIAVSRDVSVRRAAAELLRSSEARHRSILDTATDGIVTVDPSGLIETFNRGAERLFGYSADDLVGQPIDLLIPRDEWEAYKPRVPPGAGDPPVVAQEVLGNRKDGTTINLEMRVGEISVDGHAIVTGIFHDVTDRKRSEQELRESERLAATGRIAAKIAHEINNPLAGIKNSFLLIKDAVPADHPHFKYVARIENEVDRIARIVRQMFDLYRPEKTQRRKVDLNALLGDIVDLLGVTTPGRGVRLVCDGPSVPATVYVAEDAVRQVLLAILVNAIEASPPGGTVKIEARLADDRIEIFISDEGQGIPEEMRPRIFEPFFTTKREFGASGLGLGLAVAREIVDGLQGSLDFRSSPGDGTTFHISIPQGILN